MSLKERLVSVVSSSSLSFFQSTLRIRMYLNGIKVHVAGIDRASSVSLGGCLTRYKKYFFYNQL